MLFYFSVRGGEEKMERVDDKIVANQTKHQGNAHVSTLELGFVTYARLPQEEIVTCFVTEREGQC